MIYFIKTKEHPYVKIGFTTDKKPYARLSALQTASPLELEIVNFYEGSEKLEHDLHQKFSDSRLRGEWFYWSKEIQDWLESDNGMRPVWYPAKPVKLNDLKIYIKSRLKYDKETSFANRRARKASQKRLLAAAEYLETNFPKGRA